MCKNKEISILIFGDICPTVDTVGAFESGVTNRLVHQKIINLVNKSDIIVGNLECALTDNPSPIKKAGPVLFGKTVCANTLKNIGFDALSLANNHIKDCGEEGVASTIKSCKDRGIQTFGAGENLERSKRPYIVSCKGRKIAFISFAEQEFNTATKNEFGASFVDEFNDFDLIESIKSTVDYLVVLYHGGIEYHPYPSPMLQKRCRKFAKSGADVVLCQHSHCVGTYEKYNNSFILYGQGNSIFGFRNNSKSWNQGLLVQLNITEENYDVQLIPCKTTSDSIVTLMNDEESSSFIQRIDLNSQSILNEEFVESEWIKFCSKAENLNIPLLLGWNRYMIYINRKTNGMLLKLLYNKTKRNITNNLVRCVSHREVLRTILDQYKF
jgi:poly-gamma-glutamate synthesis protein (capsule biosynthesis protein)